MKIDIVIVNWNAGGLLQECIDSVISQSMNLVNKIIGVDNNSNEESILFLSEITQVR